MGCQADRVGILAQPRVICLLCIAGVVAARGGRDEGLAGVGICWCGYSGCDSDRLDDAEVAS